MFFKTANEYNTYFSSPYTVSPYVSHYINAPESYDLLASFEKSFLIPDEESQSKDTTNKCLHKKRRRYHSEITMKPTYPLINSIVPMSRPSDDYRLQHIHQSDLHKNEQYAQFKFLSSFDHYCSIIKNQSTTISKEDLTDILNKLTFMLKNFNHDQEQDQLFILIDILNALIYVRPSVLASVSQNEFFSILQISFINILRHWRHFSFLPNDKSFIFRTITKLLNIVINNIDNVNLLTSWLTNATLFKQITKCLIDIATLGKFLDQQNEHQLKYFIRLVNAYTLYQERLNYENNSNKDILIKLLNPIVKCLTSTHFINIFTNIRIDAANMSIIQKFFLIRCPTFLISYNGSRLEQIMENLLLTMLPQYVILLDKFVPLANSWKKPIIRSVEYLLNTINHGANQFEINGKLVSSHLSLIDHVLKLVNEPIFYNNLGENSSSAEMILMDTAINFLVNMIKEPSILAHIKQSHMVQVFLRLTSCDYEPLIFNVYTLLAYTTREDDIKAMHNPGRLLAIIIESLKTTINEESDKVIQLEQLLETLKGLVQHDQIKDEIIKQNTLPFLLECTNKLTGRALSLLLEVLWCLTFFTEIADVLRANSDFLEKIQTSYRDHSNEPLKKAVDGLAWKLVHEPVFLEKVTKQEEEEEEAEEIKADETTLNTEVVIGADGKEQLVTTTNQDSNSPSERSFQYDIMISYCHADKELTYKIHKFLVDKGFKVWIDLDNMYGPAMSAMANAVENSEFVLMCMSDGYKQSAYCQAEAEYAFKCKRRLIPLITRRGYKPDGWLGFMIGSRMYVNFGRYTFETACEKLLTEINLQRKQPMPTIVINPPDDEILVETLPVPSKHTKKKKKPPSEHSSKNTPIKKDLISSLLKLRQSKIEFFRKPIKQWTELDVKDFLLVHRLNNMVLLCEGMNGQALIQLYKICTTNSLRAYSVLKDELKSISDTKLSISVYSRFLSAMREAIKSSSIPPPPQPAVTSESNSNSLVSINPTPFVPASDLNATYDFSITTDASPLDTLKMVHYYGPQLLETLHRRITNAL